MILKILTVFLGSGLGGALRWLISQQCNGHYPIGTLTVNVVGCLCIGLFNALLTRTGAGGDTLRLLLIAGFCGGFTTFSTFVNENFLMLKGSELMESLLYTLLSLALGLVAVWLGNRLGQA